MLVAISIALGSLIFLGLTALFTGTGSLLVLISHHANKTVIGTKRRVHVMPHNRVRMQPDEGLDVPSGWEDATKIRCFGFDLYNPSPYPAYATVHVDRLRMGVARRHLPAIAFYNLNDKDGVTLQPQIPEEVWVAVYNENGWPSERTVKILARFAVNSTAKEHNMTRRVWIQPLGWQGAY